MVTNTVLKLRMNIRSGKVYDARNPRVYNPPYLRFGTWDYFSTRQKLKLVIFIKFKSLVIWSSTQHQQNIANCYQYIVRTRKKPTVTS